MAGSKIFLEPILSDTVGGIQSAVDEVVTVLDPVPEQISEQVKLLKDVSLIMSGGVISMPVSADNYDVTKNIKHTAVDYNETKTPGNTFARYYIPIVKIQSFCKGTIAVIVDHPHFEYGNAASESYFKCALGVLDKDNLEYFVSDFNAQRTAAINTLAEVTYSNMLYAIPIDAGIFTLCFVIEIKTTNAGETMTLKASTAANALSVEYRLINISEEPFVGI